MSDHIADASKMVNSCAWCGREPESKQYGLACVTLYYCGDESCFNSDRADNLREWNDLQRRILAQRREDFEAGRRWADPSWSYEILGETPAKRKRIDLAFEDYIAKESGKDGK